MKTTSYVNHIEYEVNQIRLSIYEKTNNMTPEQLTEYYKQSTEATIKNMVSRLFPTQTKKCKSLFSIFLPLDWRVQFFAILGGSDAAYLEGTLGIDDDEWRKIGRQDNGEKILNRL